MFSRLFATLKRRLFLHTGIALFHDWVLNGIKIDLSGIGIGAKMKKAVVQGEYERAETSACRSMIRPGDQILELGGAIGYLGLFCLKQCGAARVCSVEGNPNTVKLLKNNYALNSYHQDVIEAAVSAKDGLLNFHTGTDLWQDGNIPRSSLQQRIQVSGLSLSSVLSRMTFKPNVLIADIEGAETTIDWSMLPSSVDRIIIELHPCVSGPQSAFALLHRWMSDGYEVVFRMGDVFGLQRSAKN